MALWTSTEAAQATQGTLKGGAWEAVGVSIDSRTLRAGELFVAIAGENFDGHDYVAQALQKGAAAALVSRIPAALPQDAKLLVVADTMQGLCDLAKAARARSGAQVVGITGSVGKTSTKEMLALALAALGETYFSKGNLNNHIGVPLNLANLPESARYAILEMGMNHVGEISPLSRLARPHVAVITCVEAVHLEFFESELGIADAKCEIFDGLEQGGTGVLNLDNRHHDYCAARAAEKDVARLLYFGEAASADVKIEDYKISNLRSHILLKVAGQPVVVEFGAIGKHWAGVAASALAVVLALGGDVNRAAQGLAGFREVSGRGTLEAIVVAGGEAVLIDDSYNASPASMRSAFRKLADVHEARAATGRKVVVLGDMLELGETAPHLHAALAEDLQLAGVAQVLGAGKLMQNLFSALPASLRGGYAETSAALLPLVRAQLKAGDTVLVKGSHGSKLYELATALKSAAPQHGGRIAL